MYSTLFALAIIGIVLCLWRDSLRARERAHRVSRRACEGQGVQFLDDTVFLVRVRPVFDHGRPQLERVYKFEYSSGGNDRQSGSVMLTGPRLETLFMECMQPPEPAAPGASSDVVVPLDPGRRVH